MSSSFALLPSDCLDVSCARTLFARARCGAHEHDGSEFPLSQGFFVSAAFGWSMK